MAVIRPASLTEELFADALRDLARRDQDLAQVQERWGPPPLWTRPPGFSTLVHIILEQQVSLASAEAAFKRLLALAKPLSPGRFLELDDPRLRAIGFSRQKAAYVRALAHAIMAGELDLGALETMDDDEARAALLEVKGIGPWTADIYLLMALRRPDVWPVGDLALAVAAQRIKGLGSRPTARQLEALGVPWRPWRAVAARVLWHAYLSAGGPDRSSMVIQ